MVGWIHDEATALCGTTERTDVWVGEDVSKRCTNFEQPTVLVFIAGVADPLVKSGLDAVELQRHHFRTSAKGLADGRGLHHSHHGVKGGLSGCHVNIGDAFFAKGGAAVR